MSMLNREIYYVQNPAIGAAILWRFTCGYYKNENKPVPFPLLFVALPIILREDLCRVITSTQKRSGLPKASEKLFKKKAMNELYTVNNAAIDLRPLTLESIRIGIACGLLLVNYETALVSPLIEAKKTMTVEVNKLLDAAEKLGGWCSKMSLMEVCKLLKVRL